MVPLTDALIASIPADKLAEVESFIAVEARGFVLASLLAQRTGKGLLLVRKAGNYHLQWSVSVIAWNMGWIG